MRDLSGHVILFDLDGTLVDTAPDLVGTVNHIIARRGHPPVPEAIVRPLIGYGAKAMLREALARAGDPVEEEELSALHRDYLVHYEARIAEESRPFPGLLPALDRLEAAGAAFAVCTNKSSRLAALLLDALDLSRRFAALAGADTFGVGKPDPRMVRGTMAAAGAVPGRTIFVGDSRIDVEAARAAALPIVGVTFGYTDVPMEDLAPDVLLSRYDGLVAAVERLAGGGHG